MRTYQLFSFAQTGTDPLAAIDFELPVARSDGSVQPFPYAAAALIKKIKNRAYQDLGYDDATIAAMENRAVRAGDAWAPVFRAPLLDAAKYADTAGRKVYRAKTLVGIWATGPFLHNGSVPTIYDLLHPAADRPLTFPMGTREYDAVKLGIQTDPSRYTLAPDQSTFTFDTRLPGNWNTGHEWSFYPDLDDAKRYDIIEFLKTFTSEAQIGMAAEPGYRAASVQALPEDGTSRHRGGGSTLPRLTAPAMLVLLFLLVPVAAVLYYLVNGLLPHGEAARGTEAEDIATLTTGLLAIQQRFAAEQYRALARGTHAKGTGVRGQFEVFDVFDAVGDRALAARLAHGIFAKPGVYLAVIRFANASSQIFPDPDKDVRACSFSVDFPPGVLGPSQVRQDFSMNNARTFPINDPHAFAVTTRVVAASSVARGLFALRMKDKLAFARTAVLAAPQSRRPKVAYQQESVLEHRAIPPRAGRRREVRRVRLRGKRLDAARQRPELPAGGAHSTRDAGRPDELLRLRPAAPRSRPDDVLGPPPLADLLDRERQRAMERVAGAVPHRRAVDACGEYRAAARRRRGALDRRLGQLGTRLQADGRHQPRPRLRRVGEPPRAPRRGVAGGGCIAGRIQLARSSGFDSNRLRLCLIGWRFAHCRSAYRADGGRPWRLPSGL